MTSTLEAPPGSGPEIDYSTRSREFPLLEGPGSRLSEMLRALRIFAEFIRGVRALHFAGPCVTVFGSARFREDHRYYRLAREVGQHIARAGYAVMTGAGPGIMEAANRGARDVGGRSIGCAIRLPLEEEHNSYLDRYVEFHYFFVRKVMLVKYSQAFVVLPGGFGTMDEIFETATLIQTRKIERFPLVLMGAVYWQPLLCYLREVMARAGTIGAEDAVLFVLTDSPAEAVAAIRAGARVWRRSQRARRLLGERSQR